jgi:SEC-C motif-containing protein
MRSRYAAYVLVKINYILKTEHSDSSPQPKNNILRRKEIKQFCQQTKFIGLQILGQASLSENQATVNFRAILSQNGRDASYTECSLFEKRNGRWFYQKAHTT